MKVLVILLSGLIANLALAREAQDQQPQAMQDQQTEQNQQMQQPDQQQMQQPDQQQPMQQDDQQATEQQQPMMQQPAEQQPVVQPAVVARPAVVAPVYETVRDVVLPSEAIVHPTKYASSAIHIPHQHLVRYWKKIFKYYPEHFHLTRIHDINTHHRYHTKVIHQRIKTSSDCDTAVGTATHEVVPTIQEVLPDIIQPTVPTCCAQPVIPTGCGGCGGFGY